MDNNEPTKTMIETSLIRFPMRKPLAGWRLNQVAINEAVKELNINLPLTIKFRCYAVTRISRHEYDTCWGQHACRPPDPGIHYIWLNEELLIERANYTLWHELAHAMQAERVARLTGRPAWEFHATVYTDAEGDLGGEYVNNEFEIEARNIANQAIKQDRWLIK